MTVIQLAKAGNTEALNKWLSQCEKFIYRIARRMISNQQDALDITQEVLLRVYRNLEKLDESRSIDSWIAFITKNLCIDFYRKKKYTPIGDEELMGGSNDVESQVEKRNFHKLLIQGLEEIHPSHRRAFILFYFEDKRIDEISQMTDVPISTIKTHLFRARKSLRKFFEEETLVS